MTVIADRAAEAVVEKSRRIVMLRASWETQEKLREWAKAQGFDLAWSYSGWPQSSWAFDFHITIVASSNEVRIPDGVRSIDALEVHPSGYAVLGVDRRVPVLTIDANKTLTAIREFFITAYGVKPTFEDFKPHISLSYKWGGEPSVEGLAPALPDFSLTFDLLQVSGLDDEPSKTKDAASGAIRNISTADKAQIAGTRRTSDGYLVTEARVARGGNIQDYYGWEIGEGEPNKVFKVLRPEDEIFKADSLATFAHKPVTMGHPERGVTPDNFRKEAVGHLGSEVIRDGEFVRVPMVIMDAQAMADVEGGVREISMGYDCDLVMTAGTTPDGRTYDAYQKNIRINHCAVVEAGRAGHACRIGDALKSKQQKDTAMKTVTFDGKSFEVTDEVAARLAKLEAEAKSASDALKDASPVLDKALEVVADFKTKIEAADKATADAQKERDEAKAALPTADKLHAMAAELATVCDAAKRIAPDLDVKGKTADAIKTEAVTTKLGDAVKGKSAEYIAAMFDVLATSANDADPVADLMRKSAGAKDDRTTAYDGFVGAYTKTMG